VPSIGEYRPPSQRLLLQNNPDEIRAWTTERSL
jgi:hypothetical protein